jgi:Fe-S-cluster containining protein
MDELPIAPPETVSVEFSLGVAEGVITATAIVPAGHTTLTQILPVLQALDDSIIHSVAAANEEAGHPVSCKAGCGACCRQLVPISIFEAEALADWIHSQPETAQQQLANRFHQTLLALSASGILDRLVNMGQEDWRNDTEVNQQMCIDYLYQRIPCPFLVDESCSIHPIRPLICREYLVTSPAANCSDPGVLKISPVRLPVKLFPALNQIGAELEHDVRGWIPLVFLFAWMKANAHPGNRVSGPGPSVLYEVVRRIAQPQSESQSPEQPPSTTVL